MRQFGAEWTMRILMLIVLLLGGMQVFADNYDGTMDVFESAPELQPYFDNSFAYAVFPKVGKVGVMIGGAFGEGKVYKVGRLEVPVCMENARMG